MELIKSKMKVRYIPNMITISRIILCVFLIFIEPLTPASWIIFYIAGFSDIFDGMLARRIKNAKSSLGAELDSLADMVMVIVCVFVLVRAMDLWPQLWIAIMVALPFKIMSAVPGLIRHRKVFLLHTIANKVLAMVLFSGGILYSIFGGTLAVNIYFIFMITCVFAITVEEMVIISLLNHPNKDIKGFWQIRRVNREYREKLETRG